jgi:hypothetical protein
MITESTSKLNYMTHFGRAAGTDWIYASTFLPAGHYVYGVNKRDDGFYDGEWCSMTHSPESGPWVGTLTFDVVDKPVDMSDIYVECAPYSGDDWPDYPGEGPYLASLAPGTLLFSDDFEGDSSAWAPNGLWHQVAHTSCISQGPLTGMFHYGDENYCDIYNRKESWNQAGTILSPPIAGAAQGSKLTFDSYRDFDGDANDQTRVEILPQGFTEYTQPTLVWETDGRDANDRKWQHIEITLPYAYFYSSNIQLRFFVTTQSSWNSKSTGWFVDNVQLTR